MKYNKIISFALALVLICTSLFIPASASFNQINNTQETYKNQLDTINSNKALSDSKKINQIVNLFFTARESNYKNDSKDIDLTIFLNNAQNSFNCNKIVNAAKMQKELLINSGLFITWDKLSVTINDILINNNSATVNLYELYEYQLNNIDKASGRGTKYTIYLTKIYGNWLIEKIDSNDETITDAMGSDTFNAKDEAKKASDDNSAIENTVPPTILSSFYPINRNTAASYAYDHAYDYNLQFYDYDSDCQNFGSQCVWAGLGGTSTYDSTYAYPMYSTWYAYAKDSGRDPTYSWWNVSGFCSEVNEDTSGLYGWNMGSTVASARPGDIIQIYNSAKGWYHTYVVYAVTGTYGSRTRNDIYICAHSEDRQNECLGVVWGGTLRTIMMLGINY